MLSMERNLSEMGAKSERSIRMSWERNVRAQRYRVQGATGAQNQSAKGAKSERMGAKSERDGGEISQSAKSELNGTRSERNRSGIMQSCASWGALSSSRRRGMDRGKAWAPVPACASNEFKRVVQYQSVL